ncbi:MAG: aminotransferase class V-fold PLP-dependent enzyme [Pseudomonadota bacterium]
MVRDFDLAFVRSQFPAFSEPTLEGWAFFENAGGSYPARQTISRLTEFYTRMKVQPYAPYPFSAEGGQWMDDAKARMAAWLGVSPKDVHFGPSTTANVYTLARAFRESMQDGDAIILSDQNHEANIGAWARMADTGIEVRWWKADAETGLLDLTDLDRLLDGKVRLVAAPHCSNIVAAENDVAGIASRARAAGAASIIDGVSAAPHGLPNVGELGPDIYLFSAYKVYGPHQGVMVTTGDIASRLANQGHFFNADLSGKRLTPAGPDHAQEAAMNGVADYFDALDAHHFPGAEPSAKSARVHDLLREQEKRLLAPMLDYLRSRNDVRLLGPSDATIRVPTVAVDCEKPGEEVAAALARHKIAAWGGDFYSKRLVDKMKADPLRLSFVHYTSPDEIERCIKALDAVL